MTRALPACRPAHLLLSVTCSVPMEYSELLDRAERRYGLIEADVEQVRNAMYSLERLKLVRTTDRKKTMGMPRRLVVITPDGEEMLNRLHDQLLAWRGQQGAA